MKKILQLLFYVTLPIFCSPSYNGFCSVPVADLLGGPINDFFSLPSTENAYLYLPYGEKRGLLSSPRTAQLLFNQPVIIKRKRGKEIEIEVPYLTYTYGKTSYSLYWTLERNITKLTEQNKPYVPFSTKNCFKLKAPISLRGKTYTAGTQFVSAKQYKDTTTVYAYNSKTNKPEKITVKNSFKVTTPKDFKSKRKLFVSLCKEWAHQKNGFIPYVFGGISIGKPLKSETYTEKKVPFTKQKNAIFFIRKTTQQPLVGLDCARLLTRAAQMSNLPLYATNTKEFKKVLQPLKKNESVENGDILIWNGHIALISDVEKGLIVEARSYESGYGKVHEIPYSKQLKGITSTKELIAAHFAKTPLARLNKNGNKSHLIYDLEILKLASLEQKNKKTLFE